MFKRNEIVYINSNECDESRSDILNGINIKIMKQLYSFQLIFKTIEIVILIWMSAAKVGCLYGAKSVLKE